MDRNSLKRKRQRTAIAISGILLFTLFGFQNCNKPMATSSNQNQSAENVNFTGAYQGSYSGSGPSGQVSSQVHLTAIQAGNSVSGSFDLGSGYVTSFSGTANGNQLTAISVTNAPGNPCGTGTGTGSGTLNGTELSLSLQGTSATCGAYTANAAVTLIGAGAIDLTGGYSGTNNGVSSDGTPFSASAMMTIVQSGDSVFGSFDLGNGNIGTFTGKMVGNQLTQFTSMNGSGNPCGTGTATGAGVLNGTSLVISAQGTSSVCGSYSAVLTVANVNTSSTSFSGAYNGTSTVGSSSFPLTMVIVQSGDVIFGTFDFGDGNTGTITGIVNGGQLTQYTAINGLGNPCGNGIGTGSGTLSGNTLTINVSQATSSSCGNYTAILNLVHQ